MRLAALASAALLTLAVSLHAQSSPARGPAKLCYSVSPNPYLDARAAEVKKIYDGFFFVVGTWEKAVERFDGAQPAEQKWLEGARRNLASLRAAGVTENFLGVSFNQDAAWPSAETLLPEQYTQTMAADFGAIGRIAKRLGFRGVSIDVEYPYPRYAINHAIYTFRNYTAEDLEAAAYRQGLRSMNALLDGFPEAVILLLPGELRGRTIERFCMFGMLDAMAKRDSPGGMHLASEFNYCNSDPLSTLSGARYEDAAIGNRVGGGTRDYWKRRCSIAPGVWPLHMVETGGRDYPVQAWAKEVAELREQLSLLRTVAKKYVWSYSGNPSWYIHSPELESTFRLRKQDLKRSDIDLRPWHEILADPPSPPAQKLMPVVESIFRFDRGEIDSEQLCDAFGVPGRWWVLGLLSNPFIQPAYTASCAVGHPVDPQALYHGRDGAVRWFPYLHDDPRGILNVQAIFDWRNTDASSAHFATMVHSPERRAAYLHIGWDDGIQIRLGNQMIFDRAEYPLRGKGMLYLDKYRFEKRIPITLDKGRSPLTVTSINSHGQWVFAVRITDEQNTPLPGVRFRLE